MDRFHSLYIAIMNRDLYFVKISKYNSIICRLFFVIGFSFRYISEVLL